MEARKIIIVFDGSAYSERALSFALQLTCQQSCLITGVFLHDTTPYYWNTSFSLDPTPYDVPLGIIDEIQTEEMNDIQSNINRFRASCEKNGVKCKVHLNKGLASEELHQESLYADLALVSLQALRGKNGEDDDADMVLESLLGQGQCPVLLIPEIELNIKEIVYLHDENDSTVHALKQFTHLLGSHFQNLPLSIHPPSNSGPETEESIPSESRSLLEEYLGIHYNSFSFGDPLDTDKVLHADGIQQECLYILTMPHRSIMKRIFSSESLGHLMQAIQAPLFITHK